MCSVASWATVVDDLALLLPVARVALSEVDLMNALDTKIGGTTFKGISGGQRRRLSIAVELLRMPAVYGNFDLILMGI